MQKLIDLGFEKAAEAVLGHSGSFKIAISKYSLAENLLYAFIFNSHEEEDGIPVVSEVVYIGHTRKSFRNRMTGYQAGLGTSVNNRVHNACKLHLSTGGSVSIMVMPDRFGIEMHGIHLDVAAGLEYKLIDFYCHYNLTNGHRPLLNIAGNTCRRHVEEPIEEDQVQEQEQAEEDRLYVNPPDDPALPDEENLPDDGDCARLPCSFSFDLTEKTYWPLPVFNVPVRCQHHFGPHGDFIKVTLEGGNSVQLLVTVDRQANQGTNSPRVYFAGPNAEVYQTWKRENHDVAESVRVDVQGFNMISLT